MKVLQHFSLSNYSLKYIVDLYLECKQFNIQLFKSKDIFLKGFVLNSLKSIYQFSYLSRIGSSKSFSHCTQTHAFLLLRDVFNANSGKVHFVSFWKGFTMKILSMLLKNSEMLIQQKVQKLPPLRFRFFLLSLTYLAKLL